MKSWLLAAVVAAVLALSLPVSAQQEFADASGVDIAMWPRQVYQRASGQELELDLYLPLARSAEKPVPLVVYLHGGGWVAGSRELANLRLMPFLQMGYAAANVSYRLAKVAPAPAAVEDVRCALRYLAGRAKELNIDPQRIVLAGSSAGGHLALMAGLLPEGNRFDRGCPSAESVRWSGGAEASVKVAAIANWSGISDVAELLQPGPSQRPFAVEWFGANPDREALAREISPLSYVRAGLPPVISFHGEADVVVPPSQSVRLHEALDRARVPNRLMLVPGGRHSFNRGQMLETVKAMRAFLKAKGVSVPD